MKSFPSSPGTVMWRLALDNQVMLHRPALGADGTIYTKSAAGDLTAITPSGDVLWVVQVGPDWTPDIDVGPEGTIYAAGPRAGPN